MTSKQNWTQAGAHHSDGNRELIQERIDRLEWVDIPPHGESLDLPFCQGEGIKECIRELRIPKVSRISWSCMEFAPFGFYGIEGNYKNGRVRVYIMDEGSTCVPVMSEIWPKQEVTT